MSTTTSVTSADPGLVILRIGERQAQLLDGSDGEDGMPAALLPIGFLFPGVVLAHSPPTPRELEDAIAAVEDVLMPLASVLPRAGRLASADALASRLAALDTGRAGPGEMIGIEAVERLFNDMAAVAQGRPSAGSPFLDQALCGYLLILREFMHHLGFAQVLVRPPAAAEGPKPLTFS